MIKIIGSWWSDRTTPLVEIDGSVYALYGWNGEEYTDCWKCTGEFHHDASEERYRIRPIYAGDLIPGFWDTHEEDGSDEWEEAIRIADFEIMYP